jgi:hypothetical protein
VLDFCSVFDVEQADLEGVHVCLVVALCLVTVELQARSAASASKYDLEK